MTCVHVWELEPDKREAVGACRLCGVSRVHKGGWEEGTGFAGALLPAGDRKAQMKRGQQAGGAAIRKKAEAA